MDFASIDFRVIFLLALWSLPWKGIAMWRAARRGELQWFLVFLVLQTLGLVEIFYIYFWTRRPTHTEQR